LVQEIEKLKARMARVEQGKFETKSAKSDVAAPKSSADARLDWFKVTMTRVKRAPDLPVVRSVPHVNRMPTTVAEKVTAVAEKKADEKAENNMK
jgi:hypothetical protein